ncbi:hypothetical protein, partial [Candidatus Venteria ishoeyi]|uniref:hypothetical protein n=1 Tax=Candidatus Venteria ishoeyi TaxID=1899563 RepID=UPI00255CE7C9
MKIKFTFKRLLIFFLVGLIGLAANAQILPSHWNFSSSSSNMVYLVQPTASIQIEGTPIVSGDYIGAFYDSSGVINCAGYMLYTGTTNNVTVWEDDVLSPEKEGFAAGELVNWRIFDSSENLEYDVSHVVYHPLLAPGEYFSVNAMSGIDTLHAFSLVVLPTATQTIILPYYWSIFSTYISPTLPDIDSVMTPVVSNVSIVKDWLAQIYWPQYGVNQIGNMSIGQGYQIKMFAQDTLIVEG